MDPLAIANRSTIPQMYQGDATPSPIIMRRPSKKSILYVMQSLGAHITQSTLYALQNMHVWGKDREFVLSDCKIDAGDMLPGPAIQKIFEATLGKGVIPARPRNLLGGCFDHLSVADKFEPPDFVAFHSWAERFRSISPKQPPSGMRIWAVNPSHRVIFSS